MQVLLEAPQWPHEFMVDHNVDDSCDVNVRISSRKPERGWVAQTQAFPTILFRELTLVLYEDPVLLLDADS